MEDLASISDEQSLMITTYLEPGCSGPTFLVSTRTAWYSSGMTSNVAYLAT